MTGDPWRTGDAVLIEAEGRTVPGTVQLASGNGRSLILAFEALVLGHAGAMPVFLEDDGQFRALFNREIVVLRRPPAEGTSP